MPAIHYLTEIDRLKVKRDLQPIIEDMGERELRLALLYVLHAMEIYEAIDTALLGQPRGALNRAIRDLK